MDIKTIDHLCNLSKLNYTDEGKEKVMGEMSAIIELMDTVKEFDVVYDQSCFGALSSEEPEGRNE